MISVRRRPQVSIDTSRLRHMQEVARQGALTAADRLGPAAQRSRVYATERVMDARSWSAPQLERAAGYVEHDLAPRVSSFLTGTAHRIEPPKRTPRTRNAALAMLGAVAALGLAGAAAARRSSHSLPEQTPEHAPVGNGGISAQ
ncbi:hypothetical protein [Thermomonospora echinospora]|uniref:hypothetical protein n=1 Tax=Thermomonospora echinospora TaxID=1992 RepID=UPI0011B03C93|nr:hypothetical protein [Thermomonospora echinospora]